MRHFPVLTCLALSVLSTANPIINDSPATSTLTKMMPTILKSIRLGFNNDVPSLNTFVATVKNATKAAGKTGQLTEKKLKSYTTKILAALGTATETSKKNLKLLKTAVINDLKDVPRDVDHILEAIAKEEVYLGNGSKKGSESAIRLILSLISYDDSDQESFGTDFSDISANLPKGPPNKQDPGFQSFDQGSSGAFRGAPHPVDPSQVVQETLNSQSGINLGSIASNLGGLVGSVINPSKAKHTKGSSDLSALISGLDESYAPEAGASTGSAKSNGRKGGIDLEAIVGGIGGLGGVSQNFKAGGFRGPKGESGVGALLGSLSGILGSDSTGEDAGSGGGLNLGSILGSITGNPGGSKPKGGQEQANLGIGGFNLGNIMGNLGGLFG